MTSLSNVICSFTVPLFLPYMFATYTRRLYQVASFCEKWERQCHFRSGLNGITHETDLPNKVPSGW